MLHTRRVPRKNRPPFEAGDVVCYPEVPARRIVVAHCYEIRDAGRRRWIVAEINADTHQAALLVKFGPLR